MTEGLVTKTGTKSKVWDYFGLQKGVDGNPTEDRCTICRTCRGRVKAKYGNTSNLLSHLKTHHPGVYQEAMKSGKTPRSKTTTSATLLPVAQKSGKTPRSKTTISATLLPVAQSTIQESVERAQKYERKGKNGRNLQTR